MTDFSSQLQMASNIRIEVGSWPHKILTTIGPSQISFMTKRPKEAPNTPPMTISESAQNGRY